MKATQSIKERLFIMHLQRELDFRQMRGETPDMKHSVCVAENNTLLTVRYFQPTLKSETGGEA